jgi:hypothetical protein
VPISNPSPVLQPGSGASRASGFAVVGVGAFMAGSRRLLCTEVGLLCRCYGVVMQNRPGVCARRITNPDRSPGLAAYTHVHFQSNRPAGSKPLTRWAESSRFQPSSSRWREDFCLAFALQNRSGRQHLQAIQISGEPEQHQPGEWRTALGKCGHFRGGLRESSPRPPRLPMAGRRPWTSAAILETGRVVPAGAALCRLVLDSAASRTSAKWNLAPGHSSAKLELGTRPLAPMHRAARSCATVHNPRLKRGGRRPQGPIDLAWSPAATLCSRGSKVLSRPAAQGPQHHSLPQTATARSWRPMEVCFPYRNFAGSQTECTRQ